MAGPLNNNYDAPEYNITRDCQFSDVGPAVSTKYYAQFVARARMYVTDVIVGITSAASVAAITTFFGHKATATTAESAIAGSTMTFLSALSLNTYMTYAMNRTLAAGECLAWLSKEPTGMFHVTYEYQILPA